MEYANSLKPLDIDEIKNAINDGIDYIDYVYLHWTAGRYGQIYDDYHLSIDGNGRIYAPNNDLNLNKKRNHTYMRNSNAVGIAVCACYEAIANNGYDMEMGDYPVTDAQIEAMALICSYFLEYGLPVDRIMTHCEAAFEDGYGPGSGDPQTRWDLWYVYDNACNEMMQGGDTLRGKAVWYAEQRKKMRGR